MLDSNLETLINQFPISDLLPIYPNNQKYVIEQRVQQFKDLRSAISCMNFTDDSTVLEHFYCLMWMLETHRLPFGGLPFPSGLPVAFTSGSSEWQESNVFILIARTLIKMFPEPDVQYQVYWIAKSVFEMTTQADIDGLVAQTYAELESKDAILLRDLETKNILSQLPLASWFKRGFAGMVINSSLVRIWDKLFGGAPKILVFLSLKMFQYLRDKLLACDSYEKAERTFDIFGQDQEASDRIVNKAIEMLESNNKK